MEMKHSLSMQQKPTLIMTQRLQHALKLLQMPTLELQQALKMELERNPLLEEVDEVEEVQEIEEVKKEVGQEETEAPQETEAPAETEVTARAQPASPRWSRRWTGASCGPTSSRPSPPLARRTATRSSTSACRSR